MAADRTRAHRASIPAAAFFEDDRGESAMPEVYPRPRPNRSSDNPAPAVRELYPGDTFTPQRVRLDLPLPPNTIAGCDHCNHN
ncbi:hypothetical protein [Trichothermofontia sp.]